MLYLGNIYSSRINMMINFFQEDGIGKGPTREFISTVTGEIQRQELGIWRDDQPFVRSCSRFLNYPQIGPGEDEKDIMVLPNTICGVYYRCSSCLHFTIVPCPEHKCITKQNRDKSMFFEENRQCV